MIAESVPLAFRGHRRDPCVTRGKMDSLPEPWLRGPIAGVHPLLYRANLIRVANKRVRICAILRGTHDTTALGDADDGLRSVGFHFVTSRAAPSGWSLI